MALEPITKVTSTSLQNADPDTLKVASDICFVAGFASIVGSIAAWAMKKGDENDAKAERFGIFIGLWAPTFFILSNRFERYAERSLEEKSL